MLYMQRHRFPDLTAGLRRALIADRDASREPLKPGKCSFHSRVVMKKWRQSVEVWRLRSHARMENEAAIYFHVMATDSFTRSKRRPRGAGWRPHRSPMFA